ncbi:MFS general substrate transporter [Fomitopsis serialis]|uniref:MFS general substrate transporter n=1 Tax=Fomitopsis serialis TaxID=139415 RepID=UPI00200875F5|nr:MFS general substrate transporter [Neoantrodia serialis]KAH9919549.1 MFS general substrate transporter [Neoantrodia serialis]
MVSAKSLSPAGSLSSAKDEIDIMETPEGRTSEGLGDVNDEAHHPPALTVEEERKLWRKVDLRIVPILTVMYLCSFLDRGNIGNAKLQGLTTQLDLTGNKYNIALTMYYIPYCLLECPANLVLKKFRPSRWLSGTMVVWGIVMTLMGIVKTYPQLVGVRICLGIAEAGLFPGVVYYMTLWYPRHMLQFRIGLFYGGASAAGAFSGVLAYGISFMSGTGGLLGWSWIFIIEGLLTMVVSIISIFVIVDFPDTASFLTPKERAYLVWRKKYDNSSVGEEEHFELRHVKSALCDWQVWLQTLMFMTIVAPLLGISLFLPSIINGFGYGTAISQLLTVPPYIVATIVLVVVAIWSDHVKLRSPFIFGGLVMCLVGFAINISDAAIGAKYFGTSCVSLGRTLPARCHFMAGNNLAGQYKRGVGMAVQIGIGNLASLIVSNIYLSKDAPRYVMGHALELMFIGIGLINLPILVVLYKWENTKRDINATRRGRERHRVLGGRAAKTGRPCHGLPLHSVTRVHTIFSSEQYKA